MERNQTIFIKPLPAADLRTEANFKMEQVILASVYPLVKEFEDAPLSVDIVKNGVNMKEEDVIPVFEHMIKTGLLQKKHDHTSNVYKLTPKGWETVQQAYTQHQAQIDAMLKNNSL